MMRCGFKHVVAVAVLHSLCVHALRLQMDVVHEAQKSHERPGWPTEHEHSESDASFQGLRPPTGFASSELPLDAHALRADMGWNQSPISVAHGPDISQYGAGSGDKYHDDDTGAGSDGFPKLADLHHVDPQDPWHNGAQSSMRRRSASSTLLAQPGSPCKPVPLKLEPRVVDLTPPMRRSKQSIKASLSSLSAWGSVSDALDGIIEAPVATVPKLKTKFLKIFWGI